MEVRLDRTAGGASYLQQRILSGWHFGVPSWQKDMLFADDSRRLNNYYVLPAVREHPGPAREIATMRQWVESGRHSYHTRKMAVAEAVTLPDGE